MASVDAIPFLSQRFWQALNHSAISLEARRHTLVETIERHNKDFTHRKFVIEWIISYSSTKKTNRAGIVMVDRSDMVELQRQFEDKGAVSSDLKGCWFAWDFHVVIRDVDWPRLRLCEESVYELEAMKKWIRYLRLLCSSCLWLKLHSQSLY